MKILIQKVKEATVDVENILYNSIGKGFVVFVGLEEGDTEQDLIRASDKISKLRIFDDEEGKMNLSIQDVGGEVLSISQFTLAADSRKGNRPSFSKAMSAEKANDYFVMFNSLLEKKSINVKSGKFQSHMNVKLNNDGPVTIIMEIREGKVL